ncbi:unnamed protein product [Auanema sp. JU1783]|nr:unnamed protein product [Auanema sp. JU1783]
MDEFNFPFQPYDIQLQLMRAIKNSIEAGQIGIFESPTGTGKSLSVLCSTLTWLKENECKTEAQLKEASELKEPEEDTNVDFVELFKRKKVIVDKKNAAKDSLELRDKIKERILKAKDGQSNINNKKRKFNELSTNDQSSKTDDDEAAPDEYNSDEELVEDVPPEDMAVLKIFYASRTHSQLEQLVDELYKTDFKPRIVTIGSRQVLCVNEAVQKLKVGHLINEKCMELRKNGSGSSKKAADENKKALNKKSTQGCSFYKATAIEELADGILAGELNKTSKVTSRGKQACACPYFASRKSIPLCELVLLPYQVVLHAATRAAWGIDLKDNVLILDEAHNILQAIGSIYSAEVSIKGLSMALRLIRQYIDTYRTRLKSKNLMYMRQLMTVVSALERFIQSDNFKEDEVLLIQDLILKLGLTEINLFKVVHYMEATDLCKKFHGFFVRAQKNDVKAKQTEVKTSGLAKLMAKKTEEVPDQQNQQQANTGPIPSPLYSIKTFLEALNNKCDDGRIVLDKKNMKYRYILLNPGERLSEIAQQTRSTILVGGTMEPADLLVKSLANKGDESKIVRFTCQHVIDDHQLLPLAIVKTANEKSFTLTFQTRNDINVIRDLGLTIIELISNVPNGCVAFFPSYDYMFFFFQKMKDLNLVQKFKEKKVLYLESRNPTDDIFNKFSTSARNGNGALLCAVTGGKLSEGINFSDELGRGVIMIGLPYPNKNSVELKEKMRFLDSQIPNGGKKLYDSLCMHAVNQAVGRAIRHRKDYAAVYLIDQRFSTPGIQSQLSGWIGKRLKTPCSFKEVVDLSKRFFSNSMLKQ